MPETTLTQAQEKPLPGIKTKLETLQTTGALDPKQPVKTDTTEMTREGLKEVLSQPSSTPGQSPAGPFSEVPGDGKTTATESQTLKPIVAAGVGSSTADFEGSREAILALLDKLGQTTVPADTPTLQTEQVLSLLQVSRGNVGAAGATAAGIAGISTGAMTQTALDVARQAVASASGVETANNAYPYITAGSPLPFSSWPTAMLAGYVGRVSGSLNDGASIGGTINIVVNFAQLQTSGNPGAPGNIHFDNGAGNLTFNLVRFGGFVGNNASGTYNGQAVTGNIMNGQFYGPQAQEIGGQWNMQNAGGTVSANGNFAAKQ